MRSQLCLTAFLMVASASAAWSQDDFEASTLDPVEAAAFWTPERAASMLPSPWPIVRHSDLDSMAAASAEDSSAEDFDVSAHAPIEDVAPDESLRLFDPSELRLSSTAMSTKDVGSAKGYFTSSRLIPLEADLAYPYRATGKLLYEIPGKGSYWCTAAVLSRRVILTAGHCVHSGTASPGFYTKFVFVPAYRDGAAPFGVWPATYVTVTSTWATGLGKLPNSADYALLELGDVTLTDGVLHRIGDVTGSFGALLSGLQANHLTMLGYPGNLDGGNKLHQVTAFTLKFDKKANCGASGSDMMQGSSGGPWIQNFGLPAAGQSVAGGPTMLNRIVGVTSFGSTSPSPKAANASAFDGRLSSLVSAVCAHKAGNCS
jgi:V8-like Glu-specific endopeptidase